MQHHFPNIFKPLNIGSMELKNRVALAPMGTSLGNKDDTLSDRLISFYARIAQGGAGLITTGVAAVSKNGTVGVGMNSLYDDSHIPGFKALAEACSRGRVQTVHSSHAWRIGSVPVLHEKETARFAFGRHFRAEPDALQGHGTG